MSRRLLLLALVSCGGAADTPDAEAPRRDVLLITLDTLRADHLGAYGYPRDTSPRLDALADESVLFERCLAPMATTLPSHTSMFTGVGPIEHGVLANLDGRFVFERDASLVTLAEVLSGAGYDTGAFVSTFVLRASAGLRDGFDVSSARTRRLAPASPVAYDSDRFHNADSAQHQPQSGARLWHIEH